MVPDQSVYPVRGQLVVVENPGIDEWFSEDTGMSPELTHWCPHGDALVLGGQAVPNDWSTQADPVVADAIIERCAAIQPILATARVLEHRVGFRPTRPVVRLEADRIGQSTIVHCYGHGGAGMTLSWGCAEDVNAIVMGP